MRKNRVIAALCLASLLLSTLAASAANSWTNVFRIKGYTSDRWRVYQTLPSTRNYTYYYVDVHDNCSQLIIQTGYDGAGYGDCDLYLARGYMPTLTRASYWRRGPNNRETISLANPPKGRWYLKVYTYKNYHANIRFICRYRTTTTDWRVIMLNQVNVYRAAYGRTPLVQHSQLTSAAQNYAYDMAAKHYYGGADHHGSTTANWTLANRIRNSGYLTGFSTYGYAENIAYGYTTVSAVMTAWKNSSGHRANLLNSAMRHAGFGYYRVSDNYGPRWVQDFGYHR